MKTENIERKLKESGFIVERNDDGFSVEDKRFRIRVDLLGKLSSNLSETKNKVMNWCNLHQLYGVRNGRFFYVDVIL